MRTHDFTDCEPGEGVVYSGDRSPQPSLAVVENQTFLALVVFQAEFRKLGEGYMPRDARERRVAIDNFNLMHAWIASASWKLMPGRVKALEVLAAGGKPLTICAGLPRGFAEGDALSDGGWRDGCGRICPDTTETRGATFVAYCSSCNNRRRTLARKPEQHQHALYGAELDDRLWGYLYSGEEVIYLTRCRCGALFRSTDVRQTSCADCHARHR
jgi:hypothetical protein